MLKRFLVLCLLSTPLAAFAQATRPDVSVDIAPDTCTIGDDIFYTLTVSHAVDVSIAYPVENDSLFAPFEIRRIEKLSSERKGNVVFEKIQITLAVFDTGAQTIPFARLRYLEDAASAKEGAVDIEGKTIYVRSVLPADAKDVADIKPVQEPPVPLWIYLAIAGVILMIALSAFLIYRYLKARKPAPIKERRMPVKSAFDEATERLQALQSYPLESEEESKKFYSELSDITREFIEQHYRIAAMEQITPEIVNAILISERRAVETDRIKKILDKADLVKFAKFYPSKLEAKESLSLAFGAIEVARPKPMEAVNPSALPFHKGERIEG
ncbi:MAG: hypothetical protein IAF08_03845 [Rhizobacter sp.]|nr:hypothetical protein [Chlorobiales bacterium]